MKNFKKIFIPLLVIILITIIPFPCLANLNLPQNAWPFFGYNLTRSGQFDTSEAYGPPISLKWIYDTHSDIEGSPTYAYGNVYAGSDIMQAFCFNANSGSLRWKYPQVVDGTKCGWIDSTPAVSNGYIYVGSGDNNLAPGYPAAGVDGKLHCVNAYTGQPKWVYQIQESGYYETNNRYEKAIESSPAVIDGVVYFGSTNHWMYALNASTGAEIWKKEIGGKNGRILSAPTVVDGKIYVGCYDWHVYCLNASNGEIRWKFKTKNIIYNTTPVVNGTCYVAGEDGYIYALDADDGSLKWQFDANPYLSSGLGITHDEFWGTPAIVNDVLYVGSRSANFFALKANTGELLWKQKLAGCVFSTAAVINGVVYTGSYTAPVQQPGNAKFYALDALYGTKIWEYTVADATYGGSSCFAEGKIFYGTGGAHFGHGYVYAFSLTPSKVQQYYGPTRYETAVEISKLGWTTSNVVVLTRGDLYPDALAGASLAAKNNAPILLTTPRSLTPVTKNEINRLNAQKVIVLGSDDAVSEDVVTDIKLQTGITNIERIGGVDRYETAAMIADKLGPQVHKTAIIATGLNFPDALAAASISAYKKIPILLVNEENIFPCVQDVLKKLNINRTMLMGGSDVVSSGFASWFDTNGYPAMRLAGDDRYGTAKAIADYACDPTATDPQISMPGKNVFMATGENFPDALTCGPLAGRTDIGAPILLTSTDFLRPSSREWINANKSNITNVYIAGGPDVVSPKVKYDIRDIVGF